MGIIIVDIDVVVVYWIQLYGYINRIIDIIIDTIVNIIVIDYIDSCFLKRSFLKRLSRGYC